MTTPTPPVQLLPELPASNFSRNGGNFATLYTAEHMRSYALAAIASKEAEVVRLRGLLTKTTACISDGDSSDYARSARRAAKRYFADLVTLNQNQGEPK